MVMVLQHSILIFVFEAGFINAHLSYASSLICHVRVAAYIPHCVTLLSLPSVIISSYLT